ncbi:hypothetical protein [Rosistilla oblonga]|uniref:hypothetical protein n=1 Tax=Rosistilla oblonga TaxID=2527990 RepID=UPI003A96D67A
MNMDRWSQKNDWLNQYNEMLVEETHGLVQQLWLDAEGDSAVVHGKAASYYAVQLAIRATQTFGHRHPVFDETRLSLTVAQRQLKLTIPHRRRKGRASTQADTRQRELTLVS